MSPAQVTAHGVDVRAAGKPMHKQGNSHEGMLTLTDGPFDIAHDQAVLVIQKLDAHLGDLQQG